MSDHDAADDVAGWDSKPLPIKRTLSREMATAFIDQNKPNEGDA